MRSSFLTLIFFFFLVNLIPAQNNFNFHQFGDESKKFISVPGKWNSNDLLKISLISAGSLLTMQVDEPIRNELIKNKDYAYSLPVELGRMYGDPISPLALASAFGIYGVIQNDYSSKKIGFEIIQSALYSTAVTVVLKMALGRARPYNNLGSDSFFHAKLLDDAFLSFPSGHTTIAFSISTVLSKNAKGSLLKGLAFIPAAAAGFSRMYQDKHWASDVFLGAIIGYFTAEWVVNQHESAEQISQPVELVNIIIPL
jgi:hypothetical protein